MINKIKNDPKLLCVLASLLIAGIWWVVFFTATFNFWLSCALALVVFILVSVVMFVLVLKKIK